MKKFSFSLQKLLDYKEQVFESERNILVEMNAMLARLQSELEQMRAEHMKRVQEFNEKAAQGILPAEMQTHKYYLVVLDEDIRNKIQQIEMQEKAIDKQMDVVREAKMEISSIEKLKEKKLEEYTYLSGKADEQFIEEFISNQRASAVDAERVNASRHG
jgi:flagellar FliJ protein